MKNDVTIVASLRVMSSSPWLRGKGWDGPLEGTVLGQPRLHLSGIQEELCAVGKNQEEDVIALT